MYVVDSKGEYRARLMHVCLRVDTQPGTKPQVIDPVEVSIVVAARVTRGDANPMPSPIPVIIRDLSRWTPSLARSVPKRGVSNRIKCVKNVTPGGVEKDEESQQLMNVCNFFAGNKCRTT